MTTRQHSSFAIVFILGLLAMLMPLSIDMYLPALPVISAQFGVPAGSTQMTLSTYILGFALGQLIYGPMADSFGRKPVVLGGTLVFAAAAVACALANTIDQLIVMRFFHGLAAAAASVVINALMRDIYPKEEFSRMMSFVMLVTTIAPLMAPIRPELMSSSKRPSPTSGTRCVGVHVPSGTYSAEMAQYMSSKQGTNS